MFGRKKAAQDEAVQKGLFAGLAEVVFIILVGFFFLAAETLFPAGAAGLIFGILSVLLLLVLGVALSGALMFGYPLYYGLQKKYQEAVLCFFSSVLVLAAAFSAVVFLKILF